MSRDILTALDRIELSKATLLDFGCGRGNFRRLLASFPPTADWEYIGCDIEAKLIDLGRVTQPDGRFLVIEKGRALPFQNDEVDVVLLNGVIQYVDDYVGLLSELHRITKGYVLISRLPVWKYTPTQIVLQCVQHWGGGRAPYVRV